MMMHNNPVLRSRTLAVGVGCLLAVTLTGCDFLGFGSDDDPAQVVDEDDGDDSPGSMEVIFDEDVPMADGSSEVLEVDVPDDVYSIAISITETELDHNYFIGEWNSPDGFEFVPSGWADFSAGMCYPDCNLRIMESGGAFAALAPASPDSEDGVVGGIHEFTVGSSEPQTGFMSNDVDAADADEEVRVTVKIERVDNDVPDSGTLDLNLFFTDANGWNADDAPDDHQIQEMIEDIDRIYDQVNIDIGDVAYHDVDGSYETIGQREMTTPDGDLAELFMQSERAELDGPVVFFVEDLGMAAGIAPAIPGPMHRNGSRRSGVAVSTSGAQMSGGLASVTAHELGHHFGLFHTTEQSQGGGGGFMPEHDPLPDTEEDDMSYLMHATPHGEEMSEWQGRVMRKNPWVTLDD